MPAIKEHIKQNEFKTVYLLYGAEDYLKKLYKNKLKSAILGDSDGMNFSYFEGKGMDIHQVIEIGNTLPFFSERRLILIENSGLFKSQSDLPDYLKEFPKSTHLVFVEQEVDKRNRLFKVVKDLGTISQMDGLDEKNLKLWIASLLKQNGKKITEQTILYLLGKLGTNMESLSNEIEKLICYSIDQEIITEAHIDAICSTQISGKIFQMIDAIASKKQAAALNLYYDLLTLREKPMSILFLIARHFNILLQIKNLSKKGYHNSIISQKIGIPPFAVGKYVMQSKNFSTKNLINALQMCTEVEEKTKTGLLLDQMGVELLIIAFSQ